MSNQFVKCSKCGKRNFADDKVCGVCQNKLPVLPVLTTSNQPPTKSINYKSFFLFLSVVVLFYFLFVKEDKTDTNSSKLISQSNTSYLENTPETQLAIINDNSGTQRQLIIELFRNNINSLKYKYPEKTAEEIANALVAAYNIVVNNGRSDSLIEFTTAFDAYSKKTDNQLKMPIEDSFALFIKVFYSL